MMGDVGEPVLVQTLRGHRGEVTCADACGARLATGGGDRALRLWVWAAGAGWQQDGVAAAAHRYGVTAARWAAGGVLLASGGVDGAARLWSRRLAARRVLAAGGAAAVRALCWAGARLLAGHDDGALCVWAAHHGLLLARLNAHEGALYAVAAPANNALLLTACTNGVLKVFDLAAVCESGAEGSACPAPLTWVDGAHDMGALCAAATEDGRHAATGGHDALVRLWRGGGAGGVGGGLQAAGALSGHGAAVTALRWAGAALLASASLDRTARLWAPHDAACLHVVHAHTRYLTCITISHDARYMLTGSNDKSVRMWSLGNLTLDDELEMPCAALTHFALGDLQGISPVDEDDMLDEVTGEGESDTEAGGVRREWSESVHAGAINCVATYEDLVATASSDGTVRVFRVVEGSLSPLHTLAAHQYPAMAVDFGAGGALLLSAGLDGRACLWDVESGVQLREVSATQSECGGGGVRGGRLAALRPALLLLATDDGVAPLWSVAAADPRPQYTYAGSGEAELCCAWAPRGHLAALGSATGELRVLAPPPAPRVLHLQPDAHDLGVQSCDFAPLCPELELPDDQYLLATGGCDALIKLWIIEYEEMDESARVRECSCSEAHGGGVTSVKWRGSLVASAGADRWARVWRVAREGGEPVLSAVCAVPAPGQDTLLCAALLPPSLSSLAAPPRLLAGSLAGLLTVWQLSPEPPALDQDDAAPTCLWTYDGVARWIRDYITQCPGSRMSSEDEAMLLLKAKSANISGLRLLTDTLDDLIEELGYGCTERIEDEDVVEESKEECEREEVRARLRTELVWLRRDPPPPTVERLAPHSLLCPLSHRLVREPTRAADGYTYERDNIVTWLISEGAVSPVSGRRLRSARLLPNYALREQLRAFLQQQHQHD